MKLRDQQEEVDSLKGYSKREISELKEQMHRAYEDQLKRITEMVSHIALVFTDLSHVLVLVFEDLICLYLIIC